MNQLDSRRYRMSEMQFIFDMDKTICDQKEDDIHMYYTNNLIPRKDMINTINRLYEEGNKIIIATGRGGTTGIDWREETENQLKLWKVKYHELRFIKKPLDYLYVDDKACSPKEFMERYGNK